MRLGLRRSSEGQGGERGRGWGVNEKIISACLRGSVRGSIRHRMANIDHVNEKLFGMQVDLEISPTAKLIFNMDSNNVSHPV